MAAAYQHLAERAQALELPGAATLLARGPPRARAASAPASAAAAAAASEPASSRTLAEAPLFRNGDRVRVVAGVVAGGHTAVHHLATGLRVPAKLVGDATRLGGGGGGASGGTSGGGASASGGDGGGGRAGEVEVVLQGVREVAAAEARLVLASGLHFSLVAAGGAVDWRLEGRVLVAGGARSVALARPNPNPNPITLNLTLTLALTLTLTLTPTRSRSRSRLPMWRNSTSTRCAA